MRKSLAVSVKPPQPRVIARASVVPPVDTEYMAFTNAVNEAIRRQSLRRLSDHMAEIVASARSVDETGLELLDDIPNRN
jgi:hypothetical protein